MGTKKRTFITNFFFNLPHLILVKEGGNLLRTATRGQQIQQVFNMSDRLMKFFGCSVYNGGALGCQSNSTPRKTVDWVWENPMGKKTQARCETTSAAAAPLIFDKNFDEWRNCWEQCCGNVATTSEDELICDRKHLRSARSLFQPGSKWCVLAS